LALAVAIGSAGQTSLVQAAGSSNIGIWLEAQPGIRTICVGDLVYFQLRVIKRIGVEGESSLRMIAGINVAAEVADGDGGVGSISPPNSYTSLNSFPMPGTTTFDFKAEKAGRATVFFSARVNQVWFLGYEVSFNTVMTQVQLKVEDCEYSVTAATSWHGQALDWTALVSDVRMSSTGGGKYRGWGLWTFTMTESPGKTGCAPHTKTFQAPVELTGELNLQGDQLIVKVSYERPLGEWIGYRDCIYPSDSTTLIEFPEPLNFSIPASGASLSFSQTLLNITGLDVYNIPGGRVIIIVRPVAPQ